MQTTDLRYAELIEREAVLTELERRVDALLPDELTLVRASALYQLAIADRPGPAAAGAAVDFGDDQLSLDAEAGAAGLYFG